MNQTPLFPNKKSLLFDFDGTLVDSVPDLAAAINYMLKSIDKDTFPEETIRGWIGNGAQVLVKRALTAAALKANESPINSETTLTSIAEPLKDTALPSDINAQIKEEMDKAITVYQTYYSENVCKQTRAYPHVAATLQTLYDKGFKMAIVTNKGERFVEPILSSLSLQHYFSAVVGGDSVARLKPDPLPVDTAAKLLKTPVASCLMIGDSRNDILAAKAARMDCVGVSYGYNYGEAITDYQPNCVIGQFSELLDLLGECPAEPNEG